MYIYDLVYKREDTLSNLNLLVIEKDLDSAKISAEEYLYKEKIPCHYVDWNDVWKFIPGTSKVIGHSI